MIMINSLPLHYKKLVEIAESEVGKDVDFLRFKCEGIDSYWIVPYFCKVCITLNENGRKNYIVVEPAMSKDEAKLINHIYKDLKKILAFKSEKDENEKVDVILDSFSKVIKGYSIQLSNVLRLKILYYLFRNFLGFGVIDALMNDPYLEDVSCDGYDIPVFVFHRKHGSMATNIKMNKSFLDNYVLLLCQKAGKFVSHANPLVDATLPDGSRLQATYGSEVTPRGSSFTIRKFRVTPMTPIDLMKVGTMNAEIIAYFWALVENKMNFMVIGETASGKTTTLNALMMFIPPDSKVVSIEDTREIALMHENWIAEVTKLGFGGEESISMYDLLRAALRQRPDYVIVGEVRGKEAQTLFQAMSTGHAAYATLHAGSISQLIYRLENEPLNVPRIMIQFLDAVIVQSVWSFSKIRKRRVIEVGEIFGIDPGSKDMLVNPLFKWEPSTDSFVQESDSKKFEKIAAMLGVEVFEVIEEVKRRADYLKLLEKAGVGFKEFLDAVQLYYTDPDRAFEVYTEKVKDGVEKMSEEKVIKKVG